MDTIMTVLTILVTVQIITLLIEVEATQECTHQLNIVIVIKSIIETITQILEIHINITIEAITITETTTIETLTIPEITTIEITIITKIQEAIQIETTTKTVEQE